MTKQPKKPYVVLGIILIPILETGIILGGIAWLEGYWVTNPPRPEITFAITILWAFIDIPRVLWLWFPQRGAWIVTLCYNLQYLVAYTIGLLTGYVTILTPYFTLIFLLMIVQLLLLLSPGARKYYGITRHSTEVHNL